MGVIGGVIDLVVASLIIDAPSSGAQCRQG